MNEVDTGITGEAIGGGTNIVTHEEPRFEALPARPQSQRVFAARRLPLAHLGPMLVERAQRLGTMGIAGVAALVFCAAFAQSTLLPQYAQVRELRVAAGGAASSPAQEFTRAPRAQADAFVASLPDRDALPTVLAAIVEQAQAAGLSLPRGAYQWRADKAGKVASYQLALPVTGSYPAVRKFVDSTLATVPAAALAGISLERPNVGDGQVVANLNFEVFVRTTP